MIHDRVDGESCGGMNIQFSGDMLAVRNDRVLGNTQYIRDLFVAQTSYPLNQYIPLTATQFFRFRHRIELFDGMMMFGKTPKPPLQPVLQTPLLGIHVSVIMLAYTLFAVIMINGIVGLAAKANESR